MSIFVLGVDLDGVVADFTAGFGGFIAERRGIDFADLPEKQNYDFSDWGIGVGDFRRLYRIALVQERLLATMPVIDGASDALWRLSDAGVWIRVITHRLYFNWGHVVTVKDTVNWLDEHNIPYRDICFLGDKPQVGADCYIDDAPHNIIALRAGGSEAIVFDQPYNRELTSPRAETWQDAEQRVMELLKHPPMWQ